MGFMVMGLTAPNLMVEGVEYATKNGPNKWQKTHLDLSGKAPLKPIPEPFQVHF